MERIEIETLARRLMNKHGLNHWKFGWCDHKTTVGWCYHGRRTIEFSTFFTGISDFDIEQTILHEIAHALVGSGEGHGPVWKAKARQIGYTGKRCLESDIQIEGKFIGICPAGHETHKHRRTEAMITERFYCNKCPKSVPVWEKKFRFYLTSEFKKLGTSATPVSGYKSEVIRVVYERLAPITLPTKKVVESVSAAQSRRRDYDEGTAFIDWN